MIDISVWMDRFVCELDTTFGDRVWFVGMQGSYRRGEQTQSSDIDVVVILDELKPSDLRSYNTMLDNLPNRELICGFLSGKDELLHWEPSDLFQFYYDTKPIRGSLDVLLPLLDQTAVERAIQIGACSIYHACVHNMLHEKSHDILRALYKSASFVVQAIVFLQTGNYICRKYDLIAVAMPDEQDIIDSYMRLKNGEAVDFDVMSEKLFVWSQSWICKTDFCV